MNYYYYLYLLSARSTFLHFCSGRMLQGLGSIRDDHFLHENTKNVKKGGPSVGLEAISIDQLAYRDREKHEKREKSGPSVGLEAITTFKNVAIS